MKVYYNKKLKYLAARLRNNSTKAEIKLWGYLKNKQLMNYDFHRQKPIDAYIVDFFCNKLNLAIEVDGYTHEFNEVFEKDNLKAKRLNKLGITVLRFSDKDVINNIEGVVAMIKQYIEEAVKIYTPLAPLNRREMRSSITSNTRDEVSKRGLELEGK